MSRRIWALAAGCFGIFSAAPALAVDCGVDDCGLHGECDPAGLVARCKCEKGFVSVATYIPDRNFGAHCVPLGALPSEEACDPHGCAPHGVCVVQAGEASCLCDPGYRATADRQCVDDVDDDAELACEDVACGEDSTCMVVSDGLTCRCGPGGNVVLGVRSGKAPADPFGPACTFALSREEACGPDFCGPYGECILGQAVLCDCDDGYEEQDRTLDGRRYGYCVKDGTKAAPGDPPPSELRVNSGKPDPSGDPDAGDPEPDAGKNPEVDGGPGKKGDDEEEPPRASGCRITPAAPTRVADEALWGLALLGAALMKRRSSASDLRSRR